MDCCDHFTLDNSTENPYKENTPYATIKSSAGNQVQNPGLSWEFLKLMKKERAQRNQRCFRRGGCT